MILELLKNNLHGIIVQLYLVSGLWIVVLTAILIDLGYGIKKAKEIGELRTSEGYKRSVNKFVYYYSMMMFALMFDFIDVITPTVLPYPLTVIPLFSVLCTGALVFTELKSVHEKAEDKLRRKTDTSIRELVRVLSKREDLVNTAIEMLREEKQNQNNNETNENIPSRNQPY